MARSNVVSSTLLIHIYDPNEVAAYAYSTIKSRLDKKTSLAQVRASRNFTVLLKILIRVTLNDILSGFLKY